MRKHVVKLLLVLVLVLGIIGITGCNQVIPDIIPDPDVPCSIVITSPNPMEQLNGNRTYKIEWVWTGPNKEINLTLVGYNKDKEEIGTMPIAFMVSAINQSYTWGPDFCTEIFPYFPGDWPWWFKIEADVPDTDIWDASGFFSIYGTITE